MAQAISPPEADHDGNDTDSEYLPETLYHYTDSHGLLGIVETQKLWATHVSFLNDDSEVEYPLKLLAEAGTRLRSASEAGSTVTQRIFELVDQITSATTPPDTFVASLCANGDLLSQWRGYGGQGGGYAIGFHRELLESIAAQQQYGLMPVTYSVADQTGRIEAALTEGIEIAQHYDDATGFGPDEMLVMLTIAFNATFVSIKNPHFIECSFR